MKFFPRSLFAVPCLAMLLALGACNADRPTAEVVDQVAVPVGAAPVTAAPVAAAPMATPETTPIRELEASAPADRRLDTSCKVDSDCEIKDIGSCCGYKPACLNKDSPTFADEVKARCASEGRVGVCGFQPIEGCQCVQGQCKGILMMENLQIPVR